MTYNFDNKVNRRGTGCYKWDEAEKDGVIPMWVADMDFPVAPAIQEALQKRLSHGIFGYTMVQDSYYKAIQDWFLRRHQWQISRNSIIYTTGVVPAISCALKAMALPGEKVLVQTPVYNCFFSCIKNSGCDVLENLRIISDEIHCELIMPGHTFTPFALVNKDAVILNSPSKAFNIAGLQIANIICDSPTLRRRINRAVNINEVCDVNPFGPVALEAAYNESEQWLDELNEYLWENYKALKDFFAKELPQVDVLRLEGTYLVWIDIHATGFTSDQLTEKLLNEGKVLVNSGTMYGRNAGEGYLRINIACPREQMMEGLRRIKAAL